MNCSSFPSICLYRAPTILLIVNNSPLLQGLCLLLLSFSIAHAQNTEAKPGKQTFTYKTVGELEIKLDAHRINDDKIRPIAVSIHGGALMNGGRAGMGRAQRELLKEGYCVVSIDYRLAPETKLPEIIADVEDAFRWIHANAKKKLKGDASKLVVLGGSAGGHLTLSSGFRIKPRPAVLISFWGYGDLVGPWLVQPSPHHRHSSRKIGDADFDKIETLPPVANSSDRQGDGGAYYSKCRQLGIWPSKVSNFDPIKNPEKFYPYMAAKNVDENYPPTLMIHGTVDTDVPHEQSEIMAAEFKKHGVPHQLISVKNGEHGLQGADPAEINAAYQAVMPFIKKHTGR